MHNKRNQNPYMQHNPYLQNRPDQNGFMNQASNALFGGSESDRFIKGALIGAAAAYLLTSEKAQQTIIKGAVTLFAQMGQTAAEMKEKFEDAKAEVEEEMLNKNAQ